MRISDWSSDVCSSDLERRRPRNTSCALRRPCVTSNTSRAIGMSRPCWSASAITVGALFTPSATMFIPAMISSIGRPLPSSRSEEHTSELQSLMRISYAVFCLKKKNNIQDDEQKILLKTTHKQTQEDNT